MNPRFWPLLLWLALSGAVHGDIAVTFQNNVFTPPRLVTFGYGFDPGLTGTGVRNGVDGSANYVAQLFRVVGTEEIPIGPVANFRAATTTQPGTWSGASRTIPGVQPGEEVLLRVKVWDSSKPTYEAAAREQLPRGRSEVFVYSQPDPVLLPRDTYMVNFLGFTVDEDPCRGFFLGFPLIPIRLGENESVELPAPPSIPAAAWPAKAIEYFTPGANTFGNLQDVGRVIVVDGVVRFSPFPHQYGSYQFSRTPTGDCGSPCGCASETYSVWIVPSSRRPYLVVPPPKGANAWPEQVLVCGMASRYYRLERCDSFGVWTPVTNVYGTEGGVPVALPSLTTESQFYRVVETTP